MPTRARNGARMVFLAMIALVRTIWACATSKSARARSTSSCVVASSWLRCCLRVSTDLVSAAWASCARSSASSTETSSATNSVPASTICPGMSRTSRTVPASSFFKLIERKARTVPIEVVVWRWSTARATAMVTDSIGSG